MSLQLQLQLQLCGSMSPDYNFSRALKELKIEWGSRKVTTMEPSHDEAYDDMIIDSFRSCLVPVADQLETCATELTHIKGSSGDASYFGVSRTGSSGFNTHDTRLALRLASSYVALLGTETTKSNFATGRLDALLSEAARSWSKGVLFIMASRNVDAKCRLFAARLYSNLITSTFHHATDLSPLSLPPLEAPSTSPDEHACDWLHLLRSAQTSPGTNVRPCLAATIAALFHAVLAEERVLRVGSDTSTQGNGNAGLARQLASSPTALRLLLQLLVGAQWEASEQTATDFEEHDEANEWILILLEKLVERGYLREMYSALLDEHAANLSPRAPTDAEQGGRASDSHQRELILLLNCLRKQKVQVFGSNGSQITANLIFLAQQYCQTASLAECDDAPPLQPTLLYQLVEVIAHALGSDAVEISQTRVALGQQTRLVSVAGSQLASKVDALLEQNKVTSTAGRGSASKLTMSVHDQRLSIGLVQLLGNIAYQCPANQDLLRTTLLPVDSYRNDGVVSTRNVLHILLSCTSFAWVCFGLREWALVAIRNALEGNPSNQDLVAQLQAQEAVQSTSLTDMGIRVELDTTGKVSVHSLASPPER